MVNFFRRMQSKSFDKTCSCDDIGYSIIHRVISLTEAFAKVNAGARLISALHAFISLHEH
jgi:hypothetical protein